MDAKIVAARTAEKTVTAEAFRAARIRSGVNQRDFARLAGVTPQYLSAIESGKNTPSDRVWARLDEVLAAHGATEAIRHPPEEAALIGLYRQLPPEGRRALETTAAALVAAEKK